MKWFTWQVTKDYIAIGLGLCVLAMLTILAAAAAKAWFRLIELGWSMVP